MAFGDRLKAWRLDHGMEQNDLIQEINMLLNKSKPLTAQSVSSWESGKHYPNYDVIFLLPFLTHMTLEELFQDELYRIKDAIPASKFKTSGPNYEDIYREQHKGCKYKYRKGNFICELTAI